MPPSGLIFYINRIYSCNLASKLNQFRTFSFSSCLLNGRKFTEKHEWVELDANKAATVGVTQHAQEELGEVVFVQLPEIGVQLKQNDECGVIESVKAANEIYSPINGVVTNVNRDLDKCPKLINTNCYDKGWLFKAKVDDSSLHDIEKLMTEDQYNAFLKRNP